MKQRRTINKAPIAGTAFQQAPTFAEFWPYFWDNHVMISNKSQERDKKRQIWENFINPMLGSLRMDEITHEHTTQFVARNLQGKVVRKTVCNRLGPVRKMLRFAERQGFISKALPIPLLKYTDSVERDGLTTAQVHRLLRATDSEPFWQAMIIVAIHTGLRIGELQALDWEHVQLGKRPRVRVQWSLYGTERCEPKSDASKRWVPLTPTAVKAFKSLPKVGPHVFCRPLTGEYLSYGMCRDALAKFTEQAGGLEWATWHCLRHTFGESLARAGHGLIVIKDLMGHSDIKTTLRYARLRPDDHAAAIESIEQDLKYEKKLITRRDPTKHPKSSSLL